MGSGGGAENYDMTTFPFVSSAPASRGVGKTVDLLVYQLRRSKYRQTKRKRGV